MSENIQYLKPSQLTIVSKNHPLAKKLFNPRSVLKLATDAELKASIKSEGLLQNVGAFPYEGELIVVYGTRRVRFAKELEAEGWNQSIPVAIEELTLEQAADRRAVENRLREDDTLSVKAAMIYQMVDGIGMKEEEVGKAYGISRQQVTKYLQFNTLDVKIKTSAENYERTGEGISFTAAVGLASIKSEKERNEKFAKLVEEAKQSGAKKVTTRDVNKTTKKAKVKPTPDQIAALIDAPTTPTKVKIIAQWFNGDVSHSQVMQWAQQNDVDFSFFAVCSEENVIKVKAEKIAKKRGEAEAKKAAKEAAKAAATPKAE